MLMQFISKVVHLFTKKSNKAIVSKKVRDYGNEPFFVKKADASKVSLDKYGFPAELASGNK